MWLSFGVSLYRPVNGSISRVISVVTDRPGNDIPDNKAHGANMGPTWVLSSLGGPHVGPMNLAIWHDLCVTNTRQGECNRGEKCFHDCDHFCGCNSSNNRSSTFNINRHFGWMLHKVHEIDFIVNWLQFNFHPAHDRQWNRQWITIVCSCCFVG